MQRGGTWRCCWGWRKLLPSGCFFKRSIRYIALACCSHHCRGYNIGIRLVDEFCAKNRGARCRTFKEAMEVVARVRRRHDFKLQYRRADSVTHIIVNLFSSALLS